MRQLFASAVLLGLLGWPAGQAAAHGHDGDGGPAAAAQLFEPSDVKIDPQGNLVIADDGNSRVRSVTANTGIITTVVGGPGGADQRDLVHHITQMRKP